MRIVKQKMIQQAIENERKELEAKMKLMRFKNRLNVDELIQPLLNLEIVDIYTP